MSDENETARSRDYLPSASQRKKETENDKKETENDKKLIA